MTAAEFAEREELAVGTLRWWSSQLGRGTRAEHGLSESMPIEIALPGAVRAPSAIEIAVGEAIVRCDAGTDPAYVASLIRALREG